MRTTLSVLAASVTLGVTFAAASAVNAGQAYSAKPVVVELFTSQGCSSCPPANANFAALSERPGVIALSFGVTYWDYLGWKDTFAQPAFTQRQRDYEGALGHSSPFTPQIVVNGTKDVVGNVRADVERLIDRAEPGHGPAVNITREGLMLGGGARPGKPADVWLVRYDPRVVQVPVQRGENAGVTLPHKNVVRSLVRLGEWSGAPGRFAIPPATDGLSTAVLVQEPDGGAILAAGQG